MPISVVCPSCQARFSVSEKFAGKQGPCPKCKKTITVPQPVEEVKIHAPEDFAGGSTTVKKDAKGRSVMKPIAREKFVVTTKQYALWAGLIIGSLLIGFVVRIIWPNTTQVVTVNETKVEQVVSTVPVVVLALGAYLLAWLVAYPAYAVFRDRELEGLSGMQLIQRIALVATIYAATWGALAIVKGTFLGGNLTVLQLLIIAPAPCLIAALACHAILELELGPAVMHFALYLATTVLFRLIVGLEALPLNIPPVLDIL
jgi:predicted Zn finger-like uncharacterized protein